MKQKVFMTNKYFNSQPHKEADGISDYDEFTDMLFQLTASQGG